MVNTTSNYGLTKPTEDEFYDIKIQNDNMDTIDKVLNEKADLDENGKIPTEQMPDMNYDATGSAAAVQRNLDTHTTDKNNPHSVTKSQIGLGNVDNTSDADKPISTAMQAAIDNLQAQLSEEVFIVTYGETTFEEIASAISDGKIVIAVRNFVGAVGYYNLYQFINDEGLVVFTRITSTHETKLILWKDSDWVIENTALPLKPTYTAYTIKASGWTGNTAPYTYTISGYDGKEVNVYEDGALANAEQLAVLAAANIKGSPTSEENILYAFGEKPTIDIPVALGVQ